MRRVDATYGSDQHGLVWGYHFTGDRPARSLGSEEALALLTRCGPEAPGECLWLHFSLSNSACEPWLRQHLGLPEAFFESLRSDVGATRLEQDNDALVAVIHDVLFDFSFDPASVATASLCVNRRLLVSARLRPLRSIDQLRTVVRGGQLFRSAAGLLAHLLRAQSDVLREILRQTTQRADRIEDHLILSRRAYSRSELGSMRRVLVRLKRLLAPEPAAMFRLLSKPPHWIGEVDLQDLSQAAEELSAAVSDTAALVERVKLLQEELGALVSEQTGRTLYVLTVVTVLALPINLVAGLFGMNVGGIPLAENASGFLAIVGVLFALTVLLAYLALFRNRD
jgi:zinc transporter